jgi:hypothetical protein
MRTPVPEINRSPDKKLTYLFGEGLASYQLDQLSQPELAGASTIAEPFGLNTCLGISEEFQKRLHLVTRYRGVDRRHLPVFNLLSIKEKMVVALDLQITSLTLVHDQAFVATATGILMARCASCQLIDRLGRSSAKAIGDFYNSLFPRNL